jgi:hypothetical protein
VRALADAERIREFFRELGREARTPARAYLTGGATAVLLGWRETTIDVDVRFVPESDALLRAIPRLKESLRINVELAAPLDFVPVPPGWEERSRFAFQEGKLAVYHFDFDAQALAKLERRHARDLEDVREMIRRGLVDPKRLLEGFEKIAPELHRYPAVDPGSFRRAVERAAKESGGSVS